MHSFMRNSVTGHGRTGRWMLYISPTVKIHVCNSTEIVDFPGLEISVHVHVHYEGLCYF